MLVRGSVLERDHTGRATLLAGTLQREESLRPGTLRSSDDERLHYALDTVGDGLWDWDLRTKRSITAPAVWPCWLYAGAVSRACQCLERQNPP